MKSFNSTTATLTELLNKIVGSRCNEQDNAMLCKKYETIDDCGCSSFDTG